MVEIDDALSKQRAGYEIGCCEDCSNFKRAVEFAKNINIFDWVERDKQKVSKADALNAFVLACNSHLARRIRILTKHVEFIL